MHLEDDAWLLDCQCTYVSINDSALGLCHWAVHAVLCTCVLLQPDRDARCSGSGGPGGPQATIRARGLLIPVAQLVRMRLCCGQMVVQQ